MERSGRAPLEQDGEPDHERQRERRDPEDADPEEVWEREDEPEEDRPAVPLRGRP